jgi:hypothetical protein
MQNRSNSSRRRFPFRQDNRRPDGTWDAADATPDDIKGTSVDPYDPVWPRWRKRPPDHGHGEFISDEPFFDIDEITQKATLYPLGMPLVDRNVDGNPASRQRVNDSLTGNLVATAIAPYGEDPVRRIADLAEDISSIPEMP